MKRIVVIAAGTALVAAFGLSSGPQAQSAPPAPPSGGGGSDGSAGTAVHSITLPNLPVELPPGPAAGRDTVGTACTFCHSNRYILDQPAFPRQTWTNEVNKMRTTYGAPIAEQQVPAIVDYLVSIRGVPEPKAQP
jgi:hypothetical protein